MKQIANNKHSELTLAALTWLSNKVTGKGLRGTTEVSLDLGYVADAVALCSLQYRFYEKYAGKPITLSHSWVDKSNYFACIFEAKVSRADFLRTFDDNTKRQNRHQPIGNLHWCVTPRGMIKINELPDFWGLLEERCSGLSEAKRPILQTITNQQYDKIAHNLLWAIQARRNHICCSQCGCFIQKGYCHRCYIKKLKVK